MARYTVNRLLQHFPCVAFLETDVGQPELGPAGMVALHLVGSGDGCSMPAVAHSTTTFHTQVKSPLIGPAHTHLRSPAHAYFVGHASPEPAPLQFLSVVRALAQSYNILASESTAGLPLVINTHGWVKGLGYQLLLAVLDAARPAHIIQIVSRNASKRFTLPLQPTQRLHQVPPSMYPYRMRCTTF
jgi:polynucleotide 5'-hydroxyl-kinase GRC3/NOL9